MNNNIMHLTVLVRKNTCNICALHVATFVVFFQNNTKTTWVASVEKLATMIQRASHAAGFPASQVYPIVTQAYSTRG